MLNRRRAIQVIASAAASPALAAGQGADVLRWEGFALGATCSIAISVGQQAQSEAALDAALAEIGRMEALFSLYRADSALMRLNRAGRLDDPAPDMVRLLGLSDDVYRLTAGRFDPTIQPVWRLLAETRGYPDAASLAAARALVGWQHVICGSRSVVFAKPGMALTLNGIAQGYATDRVADVLRANGCTGVLADIGEIAAIGERAPGQPWRIAVAERGDSAPEEHVELADMSIATSSPHGTVLDADGRVGHIVDPLGEGAPPQWRRVSVIHPSAAMADGLSTAFCLMDRADIEAVASALGARVMLA
ncbi:MAG: FAD:protein FMN transferase [Brucellaceae bacterium]|nr:FAD:protein FMN transferase [Brucellaceae bacterium]